MSISFVAAVNDEEVLSNNLLASAAIWNQSAELNLQRGAPSASCAYNMGISETVSDIIVFVHQDVYLPGTWSERLLSAIADVASADPGWAVLGLIGLDQERRLRGKVWSSGLGREIGPGCDSPSAAISIDEMVIVMRRNAGLRFDHDLPGFHLYGTDIILEAQAKNLRSYIIDAPAVHNSRPVKTLLGPYAGAYRYMKKKWHDLLPIYTLVSRVDQFNIGLFKAECQILRSRILNNRQEPRRLDPKLIARKLGYE